MRGETACQPAFRGVLPGYGKPGDRTRPTGRLTPTVALSCGDTVSAMSARTKRDAECEERTRAFVVSSSREIDTHNIPTKRSLPVPFTPNSGCHQPNKASSYQNYTTMEHVLPYRSLGFEQP
jgi:hypothetical protein